jgi:outer membrane protein assembly factor BamD
MWSKRGFTVVLAAVASAAACTSTPKFQGYTAPDLYEYAQEAYESEEWSEAIDALELLTQFDPDFPQMARARLLLAHSFKEDEQYLTAVSEYVRVLSRYASDGLLAPEAALGVCESYVGMSPIYPRDQTNTIQALNSCRNAANDYPSSAEGMRADSLAADMTERLARKDFEAGDWYLSRSLFDSARIYFEVVVDEYPETPYAPLSLLRLHELFTEIGYDDLAQEALDRLEAEYPESDEARSVRSPNGT